MKRLRIAIVHWSLVIGMTLCVGSALANPLAPGSYLWYVPEHERYGRTEFYSLQDMKSPLVRVNRTQRFKILAARHNWILLEFDVAGKAYIPLRMLRLALYDSDAVDPWYEFKRATVFPEEPAKIEARLKGPTTATPAPIDSKTPAWKRYKDAWGLKPGPAAPSGREESSTVDATQPPATRPPAGTISAKPRAKHPLLPRIGSEPTQEATQSSESAERDADAPAPR